SILLWFVSHERGLVWIPARSPNMLHKTVYEMVEFLWSTLLWFVLHGRGLIRIPTSSLTTLHKTIYKMV
ncbi:hypothetical protein K443DRAFT_64557, partial [Laccaria amethystina LaAM-08-1]